MLWEVITHAINEYTNLVSPAGQIQSVNSSAKKRDLLFRVM